MTDATMQHMFANNGYGGAFLQSYVHSGCPEATIPDPVDLVILENLGGESAPDRIEQVSIPRWTSPAVF